MPKHTAQPEGQTSSRKKARYVPVSSVATEKSLSDGYARAAGARNSARPAGKRPSSSSAAAKSKGASPGSKARKSSGAWEDDETERLLGAIESRSPPYDWQEIADHVQTRSAEQCKSKNQKLMLKGGLPSMGKKTGITTGSGVAVKAEPATRRTKIANKAKGKSNAKASSSVPHKARPTRGKKAKPTTTGPIASSAGVLKKDRFDGQRRASNSKKDTATKKKTTTSIGRTPTTTSTPRGFTGPTTGRNTAATQPNKDQEQSPVSDRKVSTKRRTKEGRALKMKPKPAASPEGIDAAADAAPSAFASFELSPQGSTKTPPKEITTKKRPYVAKTNSGSCGTGPIKPSEAASGKWTEEESALFEEALEVYGLGDWCVISNFIGSRTPIQCKSHNQKLSIKREKDLARSRSSKQASKKKKKKKNVQVNKVQAEQVSTSTSPSRTVSPSPSPTTAHTDAAAVLFSMMRG